MHKKALKKCMGMPAPELELHKLMEPYKLIQSMLRGMKEHQSYPMMKANQQSGMDDETSMMMK